MANSERLQVLTSNILDPKAVPPTIFWGTRQIGRFVGEVESDGVEVMPTRWLTIEINYGLASIQESGIVSGHLSPRGGGLLQAFAHPDRVVGLASWAVFAESASSYRTLGKIQKELKVKTGRELPVVLYPTVQRCPWEEKEEEGKRFSQVLFQPCREVIKRWGVKSPADLLVEMKKRHYTGICYDTFHSRYSEEAESNFLSHWRKFLPEILDRVKEVHVSAGRTDVPPQAKIDTMGELEGLFKPELKTELNWILWELYERDWSGRVVIEVPSRALAQRREQRFLTSEQLAQDYRTIVANVRGILIEGVYPPARERTIQISS